MRAVLFDLDGTLLDIDLDSFMSRYLKALSEYTTALYPEGGVMEAIFAGTEEMMGEHPGRTNRDVFYAIVREHTGLDFDQEWPVFERFYEERFDALQGEAGPNPGAHAALTTARELGLSTVVATNPMFPRIAIRKRMEWADVDIDSVDLVTTYEDMFACKPHGAYYQQIADILGVEPCECIMVGDDPVLDIAAADVGMHTYYVGGGDGSAADYRGDLREFADLLPRLAEDRDSRACGG